MKPTHTPTPYFARVDNKNEKVDILTVAKPIKDDEENLRECIACVFDKANAAFIVRAVNAYQPMREAAIALTTAMLKGEIIKQGHPLHVALMEVIDNA